MELLKRIIRFPILLAAIVGLLILIFITIPVVWIFNENTENVFNDLIEGIEGAIELM